MMIGSLSATLSRLTLCLQTSCAWHVLIPAISLPFCFFLPVFLFENKLLTGLFEEGADLKQNFIHFVLEQISEGH